MQENNYYKELQNKVQINILSKTIVNIKKKAMSNIKKKAMSNVKKKAMSSITIKTKIKQESKKRNEELFKTILKEVYQGSKLLESEQFIQHGNTTVLKHSITVAFVSLRLTKKLNITVKERDLIRGALLHDYFLYDWHKNEDWHRWHGFRHPYFALRNASRDMTLSEIEKDIIKKHMFPLTPIPPKYRESVIVCLVDKVCSVYETFKRVS